MNRCTKFVAALLLAAALVGPTAQAQPSLPAVGQTWRVDFGRMAFDLDFQSATSMTFTAAGGQQQGAKPETVAYTVTPLREGQFAVRWKDSVGYVVHVQDYQAGTVHSFVTLFDGRPMESSGTLRRVR